jgi:ADP-ribosylglycohydrolase
MEAKLIMESREKKTASEIVAKSCGCFLGGAVGDALGSPVKLMTREDILLTFGPSGITKYQLSADGRAKIGDATQMTLFYGGRCPASTNAL